ncbi:MAG: ACT domain-containing protein [Firmicutes bacterium]|jgi:chorismate mutase|nr:ACT domain-containing protein [Bacillota bacterium]
MKNKFLVIDKTILPDVFEKVLNAKELIRLSKVSGVTEAVKTVGISRSTYYKYKDYIFTLSDSAPDQKVTLHFLLSHNPGALSEILTHIANVKGNVLTIHQDIPINNNAHVAITFDVSKLTVMMDQLLDQIKSVGGVSNLNLMSS